MTTTNTLAAMILLVAPFAAGCTTAERTHRYKVPGAAGEVHYNPERGVYREGMPANESEESLFRRAKAAFNERRYADAQESFASMRAAFPDGARAVDAVVLEALAALEAGRSDPPKWLLGEWADIFLEGSAPGGAGADPAGKDLLEEYRDETRRVTANGSVERSHQLTVEAFTYYSAGLGAAPALLDRLARHARTLAWLAYLAEDYVLAERIARDLVDRNPPAAVKARALMILGDVSSAIKYFEKSEEYYHQAYLASSSDMNLREHALLGETRSMLGQSKGWEYDITPYKRAQAKINEYKEGFLREHPSPKLAAEFAVLERRVNDVLVRKHEEAAHVFDHLFEPDAASFYRARAAEVRAVADKQEKELREKTGGASTTGEKRE